MPRIHKPQTIIRPRLRLKRQPEFSDLTLVSKEGKLIPCHRCVLVARSGNACTFYYRSKFTSFFLFFFLPFRIFSKYATNGMERSKAIA